MADETYAPRTAAWHSLARHADQLRSRTIRSFFDDDSQRFEHFSCEAEGLLLDFSRQLLDQEALDLLLELAERAEVKR